MVSCSVAWDEMFCQRTPVERCEMNSELRWTVWPYQLSAEKWA